MADKTITMKIAEFSNDIVNIVNESGLPPCITSPIIKNVLNEVEKANEKILAEDIDKYNKDKENKKDGSKN